MLTNTEGTQLARNELKHIGIKPFLDGIKNEYLEQVFSPDEERYPHTFNPNGIFSEQEIEQLLPRVRQFLDEVNAELYVFLEAEKPPATEELFALIDRFFRNREHSRFYLNEAKDKCEQRFVGKGNDRDTQLREKQVVIIIHAIDRDLGKHSLRCFAMAIAQPNQIEHNPQNRLPDLGSFTQEMWELAIHIREEIEQKRTAVEGKKQPEKRGVGKLFHRFSKTESQPKQNDEAQMAVGLSEDEVSHLVEMMNQAYMRHFLFQTYHSTFNYFFRELQTSRLDYRKEKEKAEIDKEAAVMGDFIETTLRNRGSIAFDLIPPPPYQYLDLLEIVEADGSSDNYQIEKGGEYFPYHIVRIQIDEELLEIMRVYRVSIESDELAKAFVILQNMDNPKVETTLKELERDELWTYIQEH